MPSRTWLVCALTVLAATAQASYVVESLSFGHRASISPNNFAIPGWHIIGEGHTPQLLSDKLILTPPYPGNKRGAAWGENKVTQAEWTADLAFRATGPERGGGNLQIWYTTEGQAHVGTSSIYTVGKFDGLVLVVDTYGGRGGSIRGFLNDGNTEYKNHHNVDSLAFGHCDYAYRNLGRPSRLEIKQQHDLFEVVVDGKPCFKSDKIKLPQNYIFGISAASAEIPDSFEVYSFIVSTTSSSTREEPRSNPPHNPPHNPPPAVDDKTDETPATSFKTHDSQFADLHDRLIEMSHAINHLYRQLNTQAASAEERHQEITRKMTANEQLHGMDARLQAIERTVQAIQKDVEGKDYHGQIAQLHDTLRDSHTTLAASLPLAMNHIISTTRPRTGFLITIVIVFQLLLAASYIIYKRRRANAPKKYL